MGTFMRVSGRRIKLKAKEFIFIVMELLIPENGVKINNMGME
jgi:hypothetical protein